MDAVKRQRLSPEDRRCQLIDALADELMESGWHGVSVPRVVGRAGVSQGLFYRYFTDLDDAFVVLVEQRLLPRLVEAGEQLRFDVDRPDDLEAVLSAWFATLGQLMLDQRDLLTAALLAAPSGTGRAAEYCREVLESFRQWGEQLLEDVNGTGIFRRVDAALVSQMVLGMTIQCALAGMGGRDVQHWAREMARFEAGGLLRHDPENEEGR